MPRSQWAGTDPRDRAFDRTFSLFGLDELASIRGGHQSIVMLLACPSGNREPVIVDRVHSLDPRVDARVLLDMVRGGGGDDRDRARNLRNRLADFGDRDQPDRSIVITKIGDRDRSAATLAVRS